MTKKAILISTIVLVGSQLVFGQKGGGKGGGKPPSDPPAAFGEPEIAFVNYGSAGKALMLLDQDGNMKELISGTDDSFWIASPSWSPDGDRIAFISTLDGGWGLYVIDVDGQNLTRLSDIGGLLSTPTWSPNGGWIAYTDSNPDRNDKDLFVIDVACAEGGLPGCIFHFDTPGYRENGPTWSSSGDRLAVKAVLEGFDPVTVEALVYLFSDEFPDGPVIELEVVLSAETAPVLSIPEGEGNLSGLTWSRENDQWIAVLSRDADFHGDLFLIDTETLDAFNLTNCPECDNLTSPSWSPCNARMVVSTRDPNNQKNKGNSTLAFLEVAYDMGLPELKSVTYLPRRHKEDSYRTPAWRPGICAAP
jgi:hypothetical protein